MVSTSSLPSSQGIPLLTPGKLELTAVHMSELPPGSMGLVQEEIMWSLEGAEEK